MLMLFVIDSNLEVLRAPKTYGPDWLVTGRPEGDLYYFTKIFKCNKYDQIEERIHVVLQKFTDKLHSIKEMVHLRYNLLFELVDFICDNLTDEQINTKLEEIIEQESTL